MPGLIYRQHLGSGSSEHVYDVFERTPAGIQIGVVERLGPGLWLATYWDRARRFPERRLAGEWLQAMRRADMQGAA